MTTDHTARIEAIREREQRATKGPWTFRVVKRGDTPDGSVMIGAVAPGHQIRATPPGGSYPSNDGEFIANAREDVPFLLDLLTSLQSDRDELLSALKAAAQFLPVDIQRGPASNGWSNTVAMVEAAIAKAEGR